MAASAHSQEESAEYRAFQWHFHDLYNKSIENPAGLSARLELAEMLPDAAPVSLFALKLCLLTDLLVAVRAQVKLDSQNFYKFVEVLEEDQPGMKPLCDELRDTCAQIKTGRWIPLPRVLNLSAQLWVRNYLASVATWKPREEQVALLVPDPLNIQTLKGILIAPAGCPMEGYIYFLDICVPQDFPFKPPKIHFETPVWLPKVNSNGSICCATLSSHWSPAVTFNKVLVTILTIFTEPGVIVEGGINPKAVKQYREDRDAYNKQAREWAERHNQGYGMVTFEDYFVSGIQSILKIPGIIRYEARVYCRKESSHLWKAVVVVFPKVDEFLAAVESPYSLAYQKLTGFEFDFESDMIIIGKGDEESRDKCWKITTTNATFRKQDVNAFVPRRTQPVARELKMKWVREDKEPRRLLHRLLITGAKGVNAAFESFDICVDPKDYSGQQTCDNPTMPQLLNLQIPGQGKNISIPAEIGTSYYTFGVLLLNDETGDKVSGIASEKRDNPEAINQEILRRWLKGEGKQPATWETLIQVLKDSRLSQLATDIQSGL